MPVVRVSVYLPWRPADVYCDGVEYSSYQYGLHQYWISHSGLAGCPPAAYSNIVSRIVIIGAELWPCSLQSYKKIHWEKKEKETEEMSFASIYPTKAIFQRWGNVDHWRMGGNIGGFRGASAALELSDKGWMERWWKGKTQPGPKSGMKACLDLWYMVFFFFSPLSLSLFHPHTYTWESRRLMCCLWWPREAYINSQKTMMKGAEKEKENGYKMCY